MNNTGPWAEANITVVQVTKYYAFGGQRVAMRSGDQVSYLHSDHLGSTSLLSDGSGNGIPGSRVSYFPYGETRIGDLASLPTDFGFTGQRNESTIGLYDYRARYYAPTLGRFISADTIVPEAGNPQDLNRYAYVRNNPLRYADPSGHWLFEEEPNDPYFIPPSSLHEEAQRRQDFITPSGPPLPTEAQGVEDLSEREPDYRGVSVEIGVPTLVMLTGFGLSEIGLPQVGLPVALTGAVLDLNPWTGPLGVGGAFEWDDYGHHYLSGQASWGHTWPVVPVAINEYDVRILTEDNRPATEEEVTEFVPGWSVNMGGSALYGGSLVWNPTFSTEDFPGTFGLQTGWGLPPLQIAMR